jgi:hypothetical protein
MEEQGLIWWSQGVPPRQRTKARRGHICKKIKKKRKGPRKQAGSKSKSNSHAWWLMPVIPERGFVSSRPAWAT